MLQPVSTELQKLNTVEDGRDEGVREERERMSYLAVSVEAWISTMLVFSKLVVAESPCVLAPLC
jgi:hypothetical protein